MHYNNRVISATLTIILFLAVGHWLIAPAQSVDAQGPNPYALDASDGNPIEAVYVDANGQVGIGTTTPQAKLDVDVRPAVADDNYHDAIAIPVRNATADRAYILRTLGHSTSNYDLLELKIPTASNRQRFSITDGNNTPIIWAQGDGLVGFGTNNPRGRVEIDTQPAVADDNYRWPLVFPVKNATADRLYKVRVRGHSTSDYDMLDIQIPTTSNRQRFTVSDGSDNTMLFVGGGGTVLVPNGQVGIGTTGPTQKLHLEDTSLQNGTGLLVIGNADHGTVAEFRYPGDKSGGIKIAGDAAGNNSADFYLSDGTLRIRNNIDGYDVSLEPTNGKVVVPVLQITGGSDLAEPFDMTDAETIEPGMVVAIDPDNPGQLRLADKAYDRTVAGVISGAGGVNSGLVMSQQDSIADGSHPVALTGRVYVWADASDHPIQPGDLLTTADTLGHAMAVTDYERGQGAILGKAMSPLKEGQGLVLVLVSLQ